MKIRTRHEIQDRLLSMLAQRDILTNRLQKAVLRAEIRRLQWVLCLGPDYIIVPRYKV